MVSLSNMMSISCQMNILLIKFFLRSKNLVIDPF
jgi:hypothetical protein